MKRLAPLLILLGLARPALGQSEDVLRAAFEGKTVRVKLEMPGAAQGVDVRPGTATPINFSQHATRLKQFGTAYRPGDAALVTKVHINGDHIEFQLGAGGYGTASDNTSTTVIAPVAPKTQREKDLEASLKTTTDAVQKKRMNDELDKLRADRKREDDKNAMRAAQAQAINEANLMQKRLAGGSRFNIRYEHDVPASAMTPESVKLALADYVDFTPVPEGSMAAPASAPPANPSDLRKGMLMEDVDALLGRPQSISQRAEGQLTVSTSVYRTRDRQVTAEFVEGVLIRFSVVSQ